MVRLRRGRPTLSGQLFALQLAIIVVVLVAVAGVSLAQAAATFERVEGRRVAGLAEQVAVSPLVRANLAEPETRTGLATLAQSLVTQTGVSSVSFAETDLDVRVSTDPSVQGARLHLGSPRVEKGAGWSGTLEIDGVDHLVSQVPVLGESEDAVGAHLGTVMVAERVPSTWERLKGTSSYLLTYLGIALVVGLGGSWLLSRRIKRQTRGMEPREIAGLAEHREAMLHGIKEGVIGTDAAHRVTLVNDEAIRLLGLRPDAVGRSLLDQGFEPALLDVLTGRSAGVDQVVLSDDRVVVLNRQPVVLRGRAAGSVTTLRDRTELTVLRRELDVSRHTTDTLRAQAHEFVNRLHTISGLVELGEHEEVVRYINRTSELHENLDRAVTGVIRDPALAALLIAKASLAAEQGVALTIEDGTDLPAVDDRLSADLVTVVGNLVDNAFDAVGPGGSITVRVTMLPVGEVVVTVTDSGPGVAPELAERVFQQGWSTKDQTDGHHGLGLAMIRLISGHRGGGVEVSGSTFTARLPLDRAVVS